MLIKRRSWMGESGRDSQVGLPGRPDVNATEDSGSVPPTGINETEGDSTGPAQEDETLSKEPAQAGEETINSPAAMDGSSLEMQESVPETDVSGPETDEILSESEEMATESEKATPISVFRDSAEAYAKGRGLSENELEDGLEQIRIIGEGWKERKLSVEMLVLFVKSLGYDRDMRTEIAAAEVRG